MFDMKQAQRQRDWYLRNKEKAKAKAVESRKTYTARNREFVQVYLSEHPCIDCGEADVVVLDFHHLDRETKDTTVSDLVFRPASLERIEAEIAKCVVLCANDHRRRHAAPRGRTGFDVEV